MKEKWFGQGRKQHVLKTVTTMTNTCITQGHSHGVYAAVQMNVCMCVCVCVCVRVCVCVCTVRTKKQDSNELSRVSE